MCCNVPSVSNLSPVSFHTLFFITTRRGEVHFITGHEVPQGVERYRCTLSLTLALDGGVWSAPRSGRFTPGKRPDTHCTGGWVGPKNGLDGCSKSYPPPVFNPWTVQSVASRYTDEAIPAHILYQLFRKIRISEN